ncbi:MAG: DUF4838 domain-containing protein [Planctomycetes bacterium]|nr:DUF4838 domain-containing protein [Planctomycetota bacterium]
MKTKRQLALSTFLLLVNVAGDADAQEVLLADNGQARCVIVAPAGWTNDVVLPPELPSQAASLLRARRDLYRDSVKDLARYLGKMSGTEIEIVEGLPANDKRLPIYIGVESQQVFGPVGVSKSGLFGFRVVADGRRGIGLYGESEVGTSYAIYELLDRLGCRWFMPTELGEVVPERPVLAVPVMDEKLAPVADNRSMWQGDADFWRRNRMGPHSGGHGNVVWLAYGDGSFERFFTAQDLEAHPDWRALQADGTPHPSALRPTHPAVAEHVANKIIAQLDTAYAPMRAVGLRPGYSITPGDFQVPTEDPLDRPHDPDPRVFEPAAGRWSVTDRCIVLITRIADKVRAKYPDVAFGDQAYVNKSYPPAGHPVPADFRVVICPIDFNRHHPMDWPDHVNEYWLRDLVQGWNKAGARIGAYWYGINLAELSAPCPFITKWSTDLRILRENNLAEWMPETMNGWDSMLPGYWLAIRMTFHAHETPERILDDLWTKFYGAAAEPMARYWTGIDRAYLEARQHAGSPFGYLKIFTPEVMAAAREDLDAALAACRTVAEYRRVQLIDESFGLFEWYLKMRTDWAAGNLRDLDADYETWRHGIRQMQRKYGVIGRFARDGYAGNGHVQGRHGNPDWSDHYVSRGYKDGARMEREYVRLGTPLLEWKWKHNPGAEADSLPWTAPGFDDKSWPTTHVARDTWSSLGHHLTLTDAASGRSGRMAYRATQKLDVVPAGKNAFLWIGATDGSAKLFVNGQHITYVTPDKGEVRDAFSGYCQPALLDITSALKAGDNQFTILCDRAHLNELGTGGLMGPVVLYRER